MIMSAAFKPRLIVNSPTADLWRVAETDDVDELRRILSRDVDVNARNQHGMTALMRAAYHGNAEMVRVLLEHGADPNLPRNDRFTALALAAFFGHTETVRILIEHGAKTEVVTRCGTSAYMWATARTFAEAARFLEARKRAPTPVPVSVISAVPAPIPAAAPAPAPVPAPVPSKILKDPPEIWDLVHEVPRGFNPRSAFISRLRSMSRGVAIGALTVLLLIVAGGVGVLLLRGSRANVVQTEGKSEQSVTTNPVNVPPPVESKTVETFTTPAEVPASEPSVVPVSTHPRRVPFRSRAAESTVVVADSPKPEEPATPATPATPQFEKPKPAEPSTRAGSTERLSPHLITPAQSAKPKAKVIQWP